VPSFRNPGVLGIDDATLRAPGTLARAPSSRPGILGYDLPPLARANAQPLAARPTADAKPVDTAKRLAQQRAIAVLPSKSADFSFQGSVYRVIHSTELRLIERAERYQVLLRDEARNLIPKLMQSLAVSAAHRAAFQAVLEHLVDPARGPSVGGLLLLRAAPTLYVKPASAAPAVTPSQLKALQDQSEDTKTHWISIQLVDKAGHPVAGEPYVIATADNTEHSGTTDESGIAHLDAIVAGQCKIRLPKRDQDAWSKSG
jgi:hypothetical protein